MWCVWHDMWAGTFELICGREKAAELLAGGMTKVNNRPCRLQVVGDWPELGAVQIRVTTPTEGREARYDWEQAAA